MYVNALPTMRTSRRASDRAGRFFLDPMRCGQNMPGSNRADESLIQINAGIGRGEKN